MKRAEQIWIIALGTCLGNFLTGLTILIITLIFYTAALIAILERFNLIE